jgi:hypothetical protein
MAVASGMLRASALPSSCAGRGTACVLMHAVRADDAGTRRRVAGMPAPVYAVT